MACSRFSTVKMVKMLTCASRCLVWNISRIFITTMNSNLLNMHQFCLV